MVDYRRLAFIGMVVGLSSTGGLIWLVSRFPPIDATIAVFLALAFLAVAGLTCPVATFFYVRFGGVAHPPSGTPAGVQHVADVLRQSAEFGLLAAICLWLQVMEVFSWPVVITLAAVFVLVEMFIRRTRHGR